MRVELRAQATGYAGRCAIEEHYERISCLLEEVLPLSGRVFAAADGTCGDVRLMIRHIPSDSGELELSNTERLAFSVTPVAILEFTSAIDVDEGSAFKSIRVRQKDKAALLESVAKRRFDEAVATLSLAIAIAHPSRLYLGWLQFLPESLASDSKIGWGDVGRGTHIADEIGWPRVRVLEVRKVLEWFEAIPGWNSGVGQCPVGRAVAALSQALAIDRVEGGALSLIWAMVGLEALFCRQREGLKAQLATNVQLLLGRWSAHKKRFGKVYDFRSAFLHGALDVPFAHRIRQEDELAWRFVWDSDEEAGLAMVVLLASVQELIERGWHQLKFTTSIEPV
jgi:hypothetical protein